MPAFPVLVVCVGNVCRSPFAERLVGHRFARAGATPGDVAVSSAGTMAARGSAMHPLMVEELHARGGDATGFVARQLQPGMVEEAGLVLTATRAIRTRLLEDTPSAFRRTFTVLELAALAEHGPAGDSLHELVAAAHDVRTGRPPGDHDVSDPIRGTPEEFVACADELDAAVDRIVGMFLGETATRVAAPGLGRTS